MEMYTPLWIELVLNGLVIAILLTLPLLVGLTILSILRRSIKKDRLAFEEKIINMVEEIRQDQKVIRNSIKSEDQNAD